MLKQDIRFIPNDRMSNIEIHVSHACNLTCASCSHYSNHGHKGMLTLDEAELWMKPWSFKILPKWISLMGGEPTMNKHLVPIIKKTVELWKDSRVRIITNGFFLKLHHELPQVMEDFNVQLRISVHHDSQEYQNKLLPIKDLVQNWQIKYPKLEVVWKEDYKGWLKVYNGYGDNMMPFEDKNPRKSWEHCGVKWCRQLFLGKLWKCPNLAYLQMQDQKFNLHEKWLPYLTYRNNELKGQAIEPTATYTEIKNFYEEEEIFHCGMCPAKWNKYNNMPSPLTQEVK